MPILNLASISLTDLLALLSTNRRSVSMWSLKHGSRGSVGEYSKVGEFLKIEPTEDEPEIRNRGIPFLNELSVAGNAALYFRASTHRGSVRLAIVDCPRRKEAQRII
ncbi:uncharacterized protein EAF01_006135 [Botrytis porri]|uniref:Uncharacterized protein n=1 Tax=Botrytis porri TaxID=87229 RepID=A0A4Z1KI56_9HELO|nr:uncharacterized protein EAF01_006135 [Botrytis porri]KAF7905614.1 hypothetical protein EAF01_006135 [Botrytis porri]TGO85773.1 hypothetical protein BPOR_0365g00060 [Botrytis porri]